jgi:hypothetical protein
VGEVCGVELDERRYEIDAAAHGVAARCEERSPITCHLVADECVGASEHDRRGRSPMVGGEMQWPDGRFDTSLYSFESALRVETIFEIGGRVGASGKAKGTSE